jgi:1-acyl-sn-glycerol-3-phosphate acyltransferase
VTASEHPSSRPDQAERPDLLKLGREKLGPRERFVLWFVRRTFQPGLLERTIRWLQHHIGSTWIHHFTKHLRHVYGLERLPPLDPGSSYLLIANHRSFFDLYVVIAELVRRKLAHRIVFPVRANFFYTRFLGLFVNGVMSFFAMYPPIFRERKRATLNIASLDELSWLLRRGGMFAGMHPEGTRNKGDDPYALLPAQSGVGRVIHAARVSVIPVFVNGLINDLPRQIRSNFDGSGRKIVVVFGRPVDFGPLLDERPSPRVYLAVAERALAAIRELGDEERRYRAELEAVTGSSLLPDQPSS